MNAAELAAAKVLPPPDQWRPIREAAGVSVQELADILGVSREAIYKWETGVREPRNTQTRIKYAEALRDLSQFVVDLDDPHPGP